MWDLPGPGFEPVSAALAGGFLTTVPPGRSGNSIFNLLRDLHDVFLNGCTNSHLVCKGSLFPTSLLTLVIFFLFDNSHSNRCEVISHGGFDFHFSDDE